MDNMTFQFGMAFVMIVLAGLLVFLMRSYMLSQSERRMLQMMRMAGIDPRFALDSDNRVLMKQVRNRCNKCTAEGVCERWLAGKETGRNDFCPNAKVFDDLAKVA